MKSDTPGPIGRTRLDAEEEPRHEEAVGDLRADIARRSPFREQ